MSGEVQMGRLEMMGPSIGGELVRAKVERLHAEAHRDRRVRRERRSGGLRLVLGARLVRAGYRLLGDAVEAR